MENHHLSKIDSVPILSMFSTKICLLSMSQIKCMDDNNGANYKTNLKLSLSLRTRKVKKTMAGCEGCRGIRNMGEIADLGEDLESSLVEVSDLRSEFESKTSYVASMVQKMDGMQSRDSLSVAVDVVSLLASIRGLMKFLKPALDGRKTPLEKLKANVEMAFIWYNPSTTFGLDS